MKACLRAATCSMQGRLRKRFREGGTARIHSEALAMISGHCVFCFHMLDERDAFATRKSLTDVVLIRPYRALSHPHT